MQQSRHNTELTIKTDEEELEQLECIKLYRDCGEGGPGQGCRLVEGEK